MASVTLNSSTLCFVGGSTGKEGDVFDDAWCSTNDGRSWIRKANSFLGGGMRIAC